MTSKNKPSADTKSGSISRSERIKVNDTVKSVLDNHKAKMGKVVHVAVDTNTTIELPASMTEEQIKERVEIYKMNRKAKR